MHFGRRRTENNKNSAEFYVRILKRAILKNIYARHIK
jgi:hypothetical protein